MYVTSCPANSYERLILIVSDVDSVAVAGVVVTSIAGLSLNCFQRASRSSGLSSVTLTFVTASTSSALHVSQIITRVVLCPFLSSSQYQVLTFILRLFPFLFRFTYCCLVARFDVIVL